MDCREFSNLLDDFLDGALNEETSSQMHCHGETCEKCAALLSLRMDCRALEEDVQMPQAFSHGWRQMIREENTMEKPSGNMKKWQRWAVVAAALLFVVGGTLTTRDQLAAGSNNAAVSVAEEKAVYATSSNSMARGVMYAAAPASNMDSAAAENGAQAEKIIRTASFTIKTLNFEADMERIQALAGEMGGRVEYLSTSGDKENGEMRSGSLTLRIPAQQLDAFLGGAESVGSMTALQQQRQDVSDSYYDVQARLDTQMAKMARLQALLAAAENISDLIEIESSIADTQYWIDSYMGQLQNYDNQVDYSTVRVTVREIRPQESQDVSLGQRIAGGLEVSLRSAADFCQDALVFAAASLPWLAALAAVVAVFLIIRRKKAKKGAK